MRKRVFAQVEEFVRLVVIDACSSAEIWEGSTANGTTKNEKQVRPLTVLKCKLGWLLFHEETEVIEKQYSRRPALENVT